jgi:hypothetical protein
VAMADQLRGTAMAPTRSHAHDPVAGARKETAMTVLTIGGARCANLAASRSKLVNDLAAFAFAWLTCHLAGSRADPAVVGVQVDVAAADDGGHVAAGEAVTVFQDGRDAEGR